MLTPGTRLGVYDITAQIGEGGMGAVYRATDTGLGRQVAIKVLPAAFAQDVDRISRFEREAKTLAALNHPNIATIYGVERSSGTLALVMELVEGPTLYEHLRGGLGEAAQPGERRARALPLDEALDIARQIADALEAAHEQGIIHRDLKPANVKVRPDGTVKVLDFGLAKALESPSGMPVGVSEAATVSTPAMMTGAGMILGTAAYMSPEQARGKKVDRRSDIWAFGAVLFEMLTGQRAFPGDDVAETLANVINKEPAWDALPATVPAHVRQALRLCLRKRVRERIPDMGAVRLALDGAFETGAAQPVAETTMPAPRARLPWMVAGVATLLASALAVPALRSLREPPPAATRVAHLAMDVAPAARLGPANFFRRPSRTALAISPDGATVVFVGETDVAGGTPARRLYRRPLAEAEAVAIPGTDGAEYPFFSPDGQWVGFAAGDTLKKVAPSGGPPIDLCKLPVAGRIEGASWGPNGVIAFAREGLWTVPDAGGTPQAAFEDDPYTGLYSPVMLPDGQTVLFTEGLPNGQWDAAHVDAFNLTTKQRTTLLTNAADARYSATGHLVFVRNAALLAVPFDAAIVAVTGAPVPLLAGVMQSINAPNNNDETGMGQFALSTAGTLAYVSGDRYPTSTSKLVRVGRTGTETTLAESQGSTFGIRLSPDGSRVVAMRTGDGSRASDIWLYNLPAGTPTRLTSTGDARNPLFSRDGQRVLFTRLGNVREAYEVPLNGTAVPQRVMESTPGLDVAAWTSDGTWLAFLQTVGGVLQIFVQPVRDGRLDGSPRQFSPSRFVQNDPVFSPDDRWIAYRSAESGADEVYVQAFPGPGEKRRISRSGGRNPAWSRDGRELFYLVQDPGTPVSMMAVELSTASDLKVGVPRVLFQGRYTGSNPVRSYDVTADGQFIMSRVQVPPDQPVTTLRVVLGWAEQLTRLAPTK